jgi:heat shock protein 4
MSAIGIDLGSLVSVIAVVQKGGVEIISNEASYRETSNAVGFGTTERLLGEMAKAKMKSNYKNTVNFFTRYLNLDMNSPELPYERKHSFCKIVAGHNNKVAFQVDYQGEQIVVTPEQALGAHFNKLASTLKYNKIDCREFVVTYPNYFSQPEKESLLIAARVAGVKLTRLVSETESNTKSYGIYRKADIKDTKRTVMFVDFGHSKTSVYFGEFAKDKATILYENHNRHLGARDIDLFIYDLYQKHFEKETGHLVDENPKARMRLMEAIERQRKVLSANEDSGCNVEYLVEEDDFNYSLTRDTFEKLAQPVFERFKGFLDHCVAESKINIKELHSVEIIGGGTRIPLIQTIIQQVSQKDHISKTLNQSENCARGAAICAAEVSTYFKVAPYPVIMKNHYAVQCKYQVQKEEGLVEKTGTLFKYGAELPVNMSVTLPKTRQTTFEVAYEDAVPHRSSKELFLVETQTVNPKHEDFKLIVRACIDENHQVSVKGVELEENFVEEQKKPKEKKDKKEGEEEEEFEIVKVKKTHTSAVKHELRRHQHIEERLVQDWIEVENNMVKRDNVILETNRARNDLESLLYNCKDKLASEWNAFISPEESKVISQKQGEVQNWMDTHASVGKDGYLQKVNELSDLVTPVTDRQRHHAQFADSIVYFINKIHQYSNESAEIEKNVSYFQKFKNLVTLKVRFFFFFFSDSNFRPKNTDI